MFYTLIKFSIETKCIRKLFYFHRRQIVGLWGWGHNTLVRVLQRWIYDRGVRYQNNGDSRFDQWRIKETGSSPSRFKRAYENFSRALGKMWNRAVVLISILFLTISGNTIFERCEVSSLTSVDQENNISHGMFQEENVCRFKEDLTFNWMTGGPTTVSW